MKGQKYIEGDGPADSLSWGSTCVLKRAREALGSSGSAGPSTVRRLNEETERKDSKGENGL